MRLWAAISAACLFAAQVAATPPNVIIKAEFAEPTTRYDRAILGDAVEWGALVLTVDLCQGCESRDIRQFILRLPENRVFEDLSPRIILDEDSLTSVMVVETDLALGARLSIYDESGLVDATPFLGHPHRWLAPAGSADLDGDGLPELAYVEKPHLSKELKVWRFAAGKLTFVAAKTGLTNHKIGQDYISGGIRDCGQGPEIITASADWQSIMATRLSDGRLNSRVVGAFSGPKSFKTAMACGTP